MVSPGYHACLNRPRFHSRDAHAIGQLVEKDIAGLRNRQMHIDASAVPAFFPVAELVCLAGELEKAGIINLVFRRDNAVVQSGQCQVRFDGRSWWVFAGNHAIEQGEIGRIPQRAVILAADACHEQVRVK